MMMTPGSQRHKFRSDSGHEGSCLPSPLGNANISAADMKGKAKKIFLTLNQQGNLKSSSGQCCFKIICDILTDACCNLSAIQTDSLDNDENVVDHPGVSDAASVRDNHKHLSPPEMETLHHNVSECPGGYHLMPRNQAGAQSNWKESMENLHSNDPLIVKLPQYSRSYEEPQPSPASSQDPSDISRRKSWMPFRLAFGKDASQDKAEGGTTRGNASKSACFSYLPSQPEFGTKTFEMGDTSGSGKVGPDFNVSPCMAARYSPPSYLTSISSWDSAPYHSTSSTPGRMAIRALEVCCALSWDICSHDWCMLT